MKPLIIANWKMNPATQKHAKRLFDSVKVKSGKKVEVVICPPFVYLTKLEGLSLGSQDCFWEKGGAYTGEISPAQLSALGCKYVILGHSERRIHLKETSEMINRKLKAALLHKLIPIFCIGENLEERKQGKLSVVLNTQIKKPRLKRDCRESLRNKSSILL